MDHILVKVGKLPGTIKEVALNGDRTVKAALSAAEIEFAGTALQGYEIRVNSTAATLETVLTANATVLLVKQIKSAN